MKKVCYIVMELIKGVELREFLNECDDLDDSTIRYIFHQVANAINQLHKAGIAHRDIKMDNMMITEDGISDQTKIANTAWKNLKKFAMANNYKKLGFYSTLSD